MLISCNRLKSYIKDCEDIDFVKVWDIVTMRTAEVENVVVKGEDLKDVVTAKIVSCEKHPDSKKLSLLKVSDGKEEYDVVCGAPNVRVGLIGALVKVGGMVSGMKITSRKLAGYVSNGMMCAWDELGIGSDHSGILELPSDTPLGVLLTDLYPIKTNYKYIIFKYKVWQLVHRGTYFNVEEVNTDTGYFYHQAIPIEKFGKTNLKIKYERG